MTHHSAIDRRKFLGGSLAATAAAGLARAQASGAATSQRPNILWLTAEDIGPHLGCYGDTYADSPNIDALAAHGLRYERVWSNAPVCAPARTAIITGMHPTSLGAEHMRSEVRLPPNMRLFPQLLRDEGYYCTNNSKEDYNITPNGTLWDESSGRAHWRNRAEGQPFFAVFNYHESHESRIRMRPHELQRDPAEAPVPPYHPDTPEVRHDWARYYDTITQMDARVGRQLAELEEAGLLEDTIIFFYGDHGSGMPRNKRWPYDAGLRVPFIVHVPEKFRHLAPSDYAPGGESSRLASFIDLAPTVLSLAGITPPAWMQGQPIMGEHEAPSPALLFGYSGRMVERLDMVRSVTDGRFVFVRNYAPHLIQGQHLAYMWETPTTRVWEAMHKAGQLTPVQAAFWEPKAPVELYDLTSDPHEVNNLVDEPEFEIVRRTLSAALEQHLLASRDTGFLPEPEMHRRAGDDSIREMALDPERYPLESILPLAERATRRHMEDVPVLVEHLAQDEEPAMRYWAATGLLIRGADAAAAALTTLRDALADENRCVRLVTARILAQHGSAADREAALETLGTLLDPTVNGAYTAIAALNAADALGPIAEPLRERILTLPLEDPNAPARANGYVSRLVIYWQQAPTN